MLKKSCICSQKRIRLARRRTEGSKSLIYLHLFFDEPLKLLLARNTHNLLFHISVNHNRRNRTNSIVLSPHRTTVGPSVHLLNLQTPPQLLLKPTPKPLLQPLPKTFHHMFNRASRRTTMRTLGRIEKFNPQHTIPS
jgi:hypothetical protein